MGWLIYRRHRIGEAAPQTHMWIGFNYVSIEFWYKHMTGKARHAAGPIFLRHVWPHSVCRPWTKSLYKISFLQRSAGKNPAQNANCSGRHKRPPVRILPTSAAVLAVMTKRQRICARKIQRSHESATESRQ